MSAAPIARDALDAYGLDSVCANITEGTSLTAIAALAGVSIGSLLSWIEADPERSARVREARTVMARVWDEKAEEEIRNADSDLSLRKAKELAHHLRWRSSKVAPREYGEKLALGGDSDSPLAVKIVKMSDA